MQRVATRAQGQDFSSRASWHLFDERGRERVRETRILRRDARPDGDEYRSQWLIVVDAPESVRGTGLLVWARTGGGNDQWLYLPAYRKTRRIGAMDQGESFLGSEFTFDDLRERRAEDDVHTLVLYEERDGVRCAVIDSVPRTAVGTYASRRSWVNLNDWTTTKVDFLAEDGKTLRTFDAIWTEVAGVWLWKRLEMRDESSGRHSVVEFADHVVDAGLPSSLFTQSTLRLGIR